jgi:hypothetical protein
MLTLSVQWLAAGDIAVAGELQAEMVTGEAKGMGGEDGEEYEGTSSMNTKGKGEVDEMGKMQWLKWCSCNGLFVMMQVQGLGKKFWRASEHGPTLVTCLWGQTIEFDDCLILSGIMHDAQYSIPAL